MRFRSPAMLCALLLLLSAPAGAEFYRWRDAAGREHFAQDLSRVPPEHRAAAKSAAERGGERGGGINYHASPTRVETSGAAARKAAPAAPAPQGAAVACGDLKREVKKLEKVIRTHRGGVAANQRWADDIEKSAFSRRKYELRAEEEGLWLAKAEAKLESFRQEQRRKGVAPGCLR